MRRNQPVTEQRRSEPRQHEPGGFSAFAPSAEERPATAAPAPEQSNAKDQRRSSSRYDFLAPRNWRVPTRLIAILLIPVVISLVFGGLRVNSSFDDFVKATHAEKTALLAKAATELADALESERDLTAIPLMVGQDPQGEVPKRRAKTDQALAAYKAAFAEVSDDTLLARRNDAFQQLAVHLPHLRENAYKRELYATATQAAYSDLMAPLMAFDNAVGFGSSSVTSKGRAIYAMSLAKASASTQRVLMLNLLVGTSQKTLTKQEVSELMQQLSVSYKLEQVSLNEFSTGSAPEDARVYSDAQVAQAAADQRAALKMPGTDVAPTMSGLLVLGLSFMTSSSTLTEDAAEAAAAAGLTPQNWQQATASHISTLRNAESKLLDEVVGDAANIKNRAQNDMILNSVIVVVALALAGLLTGLIARSMILGMRTLNTAALEIANSRLPDLVEKLSKTDPDRVDTAVSPIPLYGKDEIGEVARAFDQVHQQAVSLAAEQALLRGNVNAIFTNLSRRSQSLIQRQLALITDLENNEADPDQLENLFKLDHLATRMRRNGENLLVLAGEEAGRRWNTPVPLVDVLRAAASEVEQYERVELAGIPEAEVIGAAVTDLVHLLAELLENATTFSSPQTRVLVNATRLPDGRVLVEIHDKGIGLTAEDFAEINEKLAEPPTVDATISRRMGLFVVGRLSQRHDIRVQLRPSGESAGTTSLVMLPQHLTSMAATAEPEEQFTVSRIFAEQEPQAQAGWSEVGQGPSAAELGFDDHLTGHGGSSGFSPALEAMQRSQRLDQRRRAALEAGPSGADQVIDAEVEETAYAEDGYGYQDQYGRPAAPAPTQGQDPYGQGGFEQDPYGRDQYAQPYAQDGSYGYQDPHYQDSPYGGQEYGRTDYAEPEYAEAAAADYQPYGQDYGYGQQNGYQQAQERYEEPSGHPYGAEPAALPPAAAAAPTAPASPVLGSGLPQRRPGQQLAGGGFPAARQDEQPAGGDKPNWFTGAKDTSAPVEENRGHDVSALGGYGPTGPTAAPQQEWQSPNDGDWQRAGQLREPAAAGTTESGLPRRVPKQNLVPGGAKPLPQDGPQVSRSPEEVRGRLTNLRRGVEQGRSAGGDPGATGSFRIDPQQHDSTTDLFGGSNQQER
ncbi:nitrate- and nitrite sensing domain-containing protein [Kitasatospora sp. NPDC096147]|uniref:nitrate- and nitrite sensing domain-containing protein n=1 Tax=Kitasatospora sp. NPDC096147 TaxID=3364093 RepID=UPI00380AAB53